MVARSVADFIREKRTSQAAQRNYRDNARRLRDLAALQEATGQPLTARITRYRAAMAEHAARAEYFDLPPLP